MFVNSCVYGADGQDEPIWNWLTWQWGFVGLKTEQQTIIIINLYVISRLAIIWVGQTRWGLAPNGLLLWSFSKMSRSPIIGCVGLTIAEKMRGVIR